MKLHLLLLQKLLVMPQLIPPPCCDLLLAQRRPLLSSGGQVWVAVSGGRPWYAHTAFERTATNVTTTVLTIPVVAVAATPNAITSSNTRSKASACTRPHGQSPSPTLPNRSTTIATEPIQLAVHTLPCKGAGSAVYSAQAS